MKTLRTDTISVRVPHALCQSLDDLAKAMGRRRSDLLLSWIVEKVELESWQLSQVEEGIAELDNGDHEEGEYIFKGDTNDRR